MKHLFLSTLLAFFGMSLLQADFLEVTRQKAVMEKKLILLSVTQEGCSYCIKMQKDVFDDPIYAKQIGKMYLHVTMVSDDPALPQSLHVKFFPTNLVLSPNNMKIIDEFAGYMKPLDFIELLEVVYAQEFK